jgi:hypothetical protein
VITPQEAAAKWEANATAAEQTWATNLQNTTKDIVENAIAKQSIAISNYQASWTSGRLAAALRAVGNSGIKAAAAKKSGNFVTGVQAAQPKMQAFMTKLLPYVASGLPAIEAMPSGTIPAAKARTAAWIDYMHAGKGTFR